MSRPIPGAIDCDVHPQVPGLAALLPHLEPYWRDMLETRGVEGFESRIYPPGAPLACRPDWRAPSGVAGGDVAALGGQIFTRWRSRHAILNCLYGVQIVHDEHLAAAIARAVNDWLVADWLAPEPRLRASIVVPMRTPELAVEEIERRAADRRFVQVLVLAMSDLPLGKRFYWPIFAACERHGLPLAIHLGSNELHAPTGIGWPSYHVEDYVDQASGFQAQLASLVAGGVFKRFPGLKVVLLESGVTWLPAFLWRFTKFWRGLRIEVPWVDRPPAEIVRDHVRLTIQPFDAPPERTLVERLLDQLGCEDLLLYASDYPHWQFDGDEAVPEGLSAALAGRIAIDNPRATYPRLGESR